MKNILSIIAALALLPFTSQAQTTALTMNTSTGLINVPGGVTPNFSTLHIGGVTITPLTAGTDYLAPAGNGSGLTGLTKTQVGLSAVENTALSTWAGTSSLVTVGTLTSGALGSGFTAVPNARLANSAITISGRSVSLGGTITLASTDLSDATTAGRALLTGANAAAQRSSLVLTGARTLATVTAVADYVLALPGGTPAAGDQVKTYITASGADRNLKLNGSIVIPSGSTFDNSAGITLTSGKLYIVQLEYSGSAWLLTTIVGGY